MVSRTIGAKQGNSMGCGGMKFAVNLTVMFKEYPLLERFQAAANAGFKGVELLTLDGVHAEELAAAARKAGVEVVLFNNNMGDFLNNGLGLSGVPGRQREFRESIDESQLIAAALNVPNMHIGPSLIPKGIERDRCMEVYKENLMYAADKMEKVGAKVLLEPMNYQDMPAALLTDTEEALEIIEALGSNNLGLQFDFYHMYMNGVDLPSCLSDVIERVDHIQFSDSPGRNEPGSGEIDFLSGLKIVQQSNYGGWISAEYKPTKRTEDTLGWKALFENLNEEETQS
ncbi:MAG: hydroxypyruvate isomerase [Gammaproteobacteria bacterium]|nr:MAG: hydroxypyruvate isomerase [Gammaproteobacteria bacterium]